MSPCGSISFVVEQIRMRKALSVIPYLTCNAGVDNTRDVTEWDACFTAGIAKNLNQESSFL